MAASPLLSRVPKRGRKCYVSPALSRVPNAKRGEQNQKWLPHPYFLGGAQKTARMLHHPCVVRGPRRPAVEAKSEVGASPLLSRTLTFSEARKTAEMLRHPCIVRGPERQARGAKSEVAASPLLSRRPKRGRNCYITPALSMVPNAKRRGKFIGGCLTPTFCEAQKTAEILRHPCVVRSPQQQGGEGSKIRSGCPTPTFSKAQKRAEMVRHPCILGGPQRQAQEAKSEVVASPLLSRGPKRGRKCYATPPLSGNPNAKRREQNQKWLPHPYFPRGPKEGGNATSPLHCRGSPTPSAGSKIRSGCLTPIL